MLLPRLIRPAIYILESSSSSTAAITAFASSASHIPAKFVPVSSSYVNVRYATHQAQGRANGAKQGPGKRLGAKKSGGEYVIPGTIIFRQRGTHWYPGENCKFGRDHCVFATQEGWVRYYRDPKLHPKRQYIGVALGKHDKLPYPYNAPRRRRLGLVAVAVSQPELLDVPGVVGQKGHRQPFTKLQLQRTEFSARESNWHIGRAAERANVQVTKPFVKRVVRYRRVLKRRLSFKKNKLSTLIMRERNEGKKLPVKGVLKGVGKGESNGRPRIVKRGDDKAKGRKVKA